MEVNDVAAEPCDSYKAELRLEVSFGWRGATQRETSDLPPHSGEGLETGSLSENRDELLARVLSVEKILAEWLLFVCCAVYLSAPHSVHGFAIHPELMTLSPHRIAEQSVSKIEAADQSFFSFSRRVWIQVFPQLRCCKGIDPIAHVEARIERAAHVRADPDLMFYSCHYNRRRSVNSTSIFVSADRLNIKLTFFAKFNLLDPRIGLALNRDETGVQRDRI